MNNNDGKIWYGVGIDTTDIQRDSKKVNDAFKGIGDKAQAEGSRIENSFSRAGGMLTGILSATAIAGFAKKMFEVRSEFQDAESSMRIFLGSAEKASTFMKELQDYAWYNMFEFKDLTGESAKLLAFGNAVQDVIPIIDQLSNIASGTQGSLSELVNIYNKAKSIGKVDSQMLESLGSRGVVVTDVLKQMGVQVDRSAIKFEHLKMVLEHLTGEGGMFHGLMAEQMENLSASAGQLQDNIAIMLNEIGEKSQDALKAGIDSASYLVDNYERVGRIVAELILTYGAYKTAVLVLTTVQRVQRLVQLELVSSSKAVTAWQGIQAVSVKSLTGAWASLNKTMAANQFALIGMAIAAIGYGLYKLITYQTDAEIQQSKLNNTFKDASKLIAAETVQIDTLFARLKSAKKGTEDYDTAKKAIFSKYGEYLKHLGDEHTALNNIDAAYKAITESATKAARAKGLAMATEQASADLVDKQAEVLEDIKKQLDQKFGKDSKKSLEIFYQLKPIVESGKGIDSVKKDFLSLFDKTLTVQSSSFGTYTSYTTNKLKELINTGSKAMQTFDDINKRAELLYGETALKTQTKTPPVKTIVVELTPEQKKAIEDRKKLLAEISKGDLEQLRWNEEFSFQKQEAEISLWEDGTAKELALIELSYRRKILAINRQEEDLLRVIQEQAQKRAKAEGNASFDKSTVELDPEQRDLFEMLRDTTQLIYEKDKSKSFGDLIKKYQDFAAKRLEIEKKFSDQLAVLQQGKKTPGADTDKIDASIKVLKQQQEIELNALDLEIANRTEVFKVWVNKITTLGLQELVGALEAAKDTLSMSDVSDEDKAVLRAKIEALQNQIKVLQAKDPSGQKDWTATLKTMNEVNESIGNIIRGFDGLDESTKSILTAATNISGAIITSISGVIALSVTGTEAIKAVERASVILAIIGAAISVITIIINLFTSAAKKRKEQEEAAIERQRQEYLGLLDYNNELEKKYEWIKKIGEAELDFIKRKGEELLKQRNANEKEQADLYAKLQNEKYRSGQVINKGLFKTTTTDVYSTLAGKTFEEISELAAQGKLSEEAQKYYEYLKKAKEEGADIERMELEYLQSLNELATGTTAQAITDSIIEGFKAGKRSAADFADTFEKLMQGAVQSALRQMTDKKVLEWYDKFYELSKDGLTESEKEELRADWNKLISDTAKDALNLETITGTSLSDQDNREGASKGFGSMSQDSADELNGRFTALQGLTINILDGVRVLQANSSQALRHLAGIETNTARLEKIETTMGSVKSGIDDTNSIMRKAFL